MDLVLIKLSIETLAKRVEELEGANQVLTSKIEELEKREVIQLPIEAAPKEPEDELINGAEVQRMLGVCYNTLQTIVQKNLLTPIRVSARRIRYSKRAVMDYIQAQCKRKATPN